MIAKEVIEDIRSRVDILEVIQGRIDVRRAGSTWRALCPFHTEKTPSFHINPQRQIYHCFGCGAGGDVFKFIMEFERVDFPTAVRMMAERCGVRLPDEPAETDRRGPPKDRLFAVLQEAAALYRQFLRERPDAEAARAYLRQRRLDGDPEERFQIGYAPGARGALRVWARRRNLPAALLEHAGLLSRSDQDGSVYERFRDRLMFPIRDEIGRTIGFSGRIMSNQAKTAKYINSPETPVFHKGRVFFALDAARHALVKERRAIICEGQIDAIRCHEAGIRHVIASQGTALTPEHARLVRRYADSVVLVLDADRAGQDAAIKSARHFIAAGLDVLVAALPEGDDPDSLILRAGRDAFLAVVDQARPMVSFQIDVLEQREEVGSELGRNRVVRAVLETIAAIPQAVQQDRMIRQLARRYVIDDHLLLEDLRTIQRGVSPVRAATPAPAAEVSHPPTEVQLLELMSRHPEVADLVRRYLPVDCFADPDCRVVASGLLDGAGAVALAAFDDASGGEAQRLGAEIAMAPAKTSEDADLVLQAARDIILRLRRKRLEQERAALRRQALSESGPRQDALMAECHQLSLDIHLLKLGWAQSLPYLDLQR